MLKEERVNDLLEYLAAYTNLELVSVLKARLDHELLKQVGDPVPVKKLESIPPKPENETKGYPAVCWECKRNTTIPFKANPKYAVYCPECFARRKGRS